MAIEDPDLLQLLRSLDRSKDPEFPDSYDHQQVDGGFRELAARLDQEFDGQCFFGDRMEDASQHGSLIITAAGAASRRQLTITISNFGYLAVLSVDEPFAWADDEAADLLHPEDARRIKSVLADLDYTLIPEEPLWEGYDGCWPGLFENWWNRFFSYV
ncbi:hypothetical protein AB0368_07275 [Actinoplanes sp. NPDC051475]|uniref:hypothetical protein n=1 Tax=Actinoplanes sp. NPDC051475 TaxID=3157225 RepID=UPI00344F936A